MGSALMFLVVALVALFVLAVPVAVVLVRMQLPPPEAPRPSMIPDAHDRAAEARDLGFVMQEGGRWVADLDGTVVLEGHDDGASLWHVQRLVVEGPWSGLSVQPGRAPSVPTGDPAFDPHFVVAGDALFLLDDAVRAAFQADVDARLVLSDGLLVALPEPEAVLAEVVHALVALRDALRAAPAGDEVLVRDVRQCGAVRAEGLRRLRDDALARELLDDPDPDVRLLAALMVDPSALRGLVLDARAPGSVRHKAAVALPTLDDEVLESMAASDAPALWSVVAKQERQPAEKVQLLRPLLRPGALDADAWPEDHRVPLVGMQLAAAVAEARPPDAESLLVELLAMPEARVRLAAVRGLKAVGGASAVEAVRRCVQDEDPRVRAEALEVAQALVGTVRGGVSLAPNAEGQGAVSLVDDAIGGLSVAQEVATREVEGPEGST